MLPRSPTRTDRVCQHHLRDDARSGHPVRSGERPPEHGGRAEGRAGPRSWSRWRSNFARSRGGGGRRALGRSKCRARRAALPRLRATRARSSAPARCRLDGGGRPSAAGELRGLALVVGGRSLGARVACRTAEATGAVGVLCLAFPLQPPRRSGGSATPSRLHELDEVTVPTLVVQGARDRFGIPPASARRTVVQVPGDHSLKTDLQAVAAAVQRWLPSVVAQAVRPAMPA
jgi:predicted alpha/beta-hydrolase family hydrolase